MNRIIIIIFAVFCCVCSVSATPDQAVRSAASSTLTFVDDSGFTEFMRVFTSNTGMPDFEGMLKAAVRPITDQIGAFFYLILFGVPYFVLWIRQRNLIVPSIIGIIFGAWMIVKIPAAYNVPAVVLLFIIIAGGLYGIYAKRT